MLRNQGPTPSQRFFWEDQASNQFSGPGGQFLNWTCFPCVRFLENTMIIVPYMVVYSNFPLNNRFTHTPNYVSQEALSDGGGNNGAVINVDTTYISGSQAVMAVRGAINSTAPKNDTYITFAPIVNDEGILQGKAAYGASAFHIVGASLGLATAAAILGMPCIGYTGFMRAPHRDSRFMPGTKWAPVDNVTAVAKSGGLVDTVDGITQKVRWAMEIGVPLVLPYYNEFFLPLELPTGVRNLGNPGWAGRNKREFLQGAVSDAGYSVQDMTDGVPCERGAMLYVAKSICDACCLSCLALACQVKITAYADAVKGRGEAAWTANQGPYEEVLQRYAFNRQ